jgi:nitroreductase/NAD-dependent dihydropyrimidine dehydrogenase PreA subunit
MGLIRVDMEKCERDGFCVEVCPLNILMLDAKEGPKVRPMMGRFCIACGHCVAVCSHGALDNVRTPLAEQVPLHKYPVLDSETAFTFLRSRRSVRCYKEEPVSRETMLRLLEVARYTPSGHNSQGISYLVVEGKENIHHISELVVDWMRKRVEADPREASRLGMPGLIKAFDKGEDKILRDAPQIIVAMGAKELRAAAQATTYLALEYLELYATTLHLGTCWAGFAQAAAKEYEPLIAFLKIPEDKQVKGILMVGYPRHVYYRLPERNPLEVAWFEK